MDVLTRGSDPRPNAAETSVRKVSVIVPTRDRPHFLREALESIRALEAPDLELEIIVGDNGSTAHAEAIATRFNAVHVKVSGNGASVARNAALRRATGDYIAFLDDDDRWVGTHLRKHLELLEQRAEIDAVIGQVVSADHLMRRVGAPWPDEVSEGPALLRRMLSGFFPQIGSVVARAHVYQAIGGFDERLIGGEDLDWLLRLARQNKLAVVLTESVLFRGRPLGTFDKLQLDRSRYDRKVFFRHAVPEWRIWQSPKKFWLAYYGTLKHFYRYFVDAAARRAARGERLAALEAIWCAFQVFPLRTVYHLVKWRRMRLAFLGAILPRRSRRFTGGIAGAAFLPGLEGAESGIIQALLAMAALFYA